MPCEFSLRDVAKGSLTDEKFWRRTHVKSENREYIKAHEELVSIEALMKKIESIPVRLLLLSSAASLPC